MTAQLPPGRHALVISAPRAGFVLDGKIVYPAKELALASGRDWQVKKFPPTVILEDEAWLKADPGEGSPVREGEPFQAEVDFKRVADGARSSRIIAQFDEVVWRAGLLAHKGIVIEDGNEFGWGGPGRLAPDIRRRAEETLLRLSKLASVIERFRSEARIDPATLDNVIRQTRAAAEEISFASRQQRLLDQRKAMELAVKVLKPESGGELPSERAILRGKTAKDLERIHDRLELVRSPFNKPSLFINELNESRHDRLGWIPNPDLVDSELAAWGLRVNPITAPSVLRLDGKDWLFQTDPTGAGESEKRETIGYNIENQWPKMAVPRAWNSVAAFRNYRGVAWYRSRVQI